ncbi:6-phosphogluconolactonase (cycloisomerase 2 family) [Actinomadura luteofluorescens]|uniref:6-phosphogluconolactonase (Cycloisomerase 2 family) n=2 Tax=Actinomadura luteofluorescens TaxID=46163 RepID=A0A7Y9JKS8_9ACTN|nr:lactonase family protein [Actinomadura luteofluorescens]NYD52660.1 6-phosphogluconolactonase (cycloisomerase 2 family) [Actinomadura luteofluorescens]
MSERTFWVGTYTGAAGGGAGIYRVARRADGTLRAAGLATEAVCPSYLAVHPTRDVLYAVREEDRGGVVAYEAAGGRLKEVGAREAGALPCHLSVSPDGARLLVADYGSGTVRAYPLGPGGDLAGDADVVDGHGGGPRADRQEGPHAHMAVHAPDGTVLTTDLGADLVRSFRIEGGALRLAGETALPAGCGPRHLVVHPSGHVHVLAELAASVLVLRPAGGYAGLEVVAESPATAGPAGDAAQGAAIRLGDGGRFVYTSMRGTDVVTAHRVLDGGAALAPVADVPSGGHWPRDLHVDGEWMHVANERSDAIATFRIGPDGVPAPAGPPLEIPSPVCVIPG